MVEPHFTRFLLSRRLTATQQHSVYRHALPTMIIFIDSTVEESSVLLNGLTERAEVFHLDAAQSGIEQITDVLVHRSGFESVHIVSHGSPGTLYLGNGELSLSTLAQHADSLNQWFQNAAENASLYLYGCNVAAGDAGSEFTERLNRLTGADVYASAKTVGHNNLGGAWELLGKGIAQLAFTDEARAAYPHTLARTLTNGSFEEGVAVAEDQAQVFAEAEIPGWETQGDTGGNQIEIWGNNFDLFDSIPPIPAPEGTQFLELFPFGPAVLAQDLDVVAGDVLTYSFSYRGRDADQTIELALGGEEIVTVTNGPDAWQEYTGTFTYGGPTGTAALTFTGITPNAGDAGHLIDNVQIDFAPLVEFAAATNESDENVGGDLPQIVVSGTFSEAGSIDVTVTGGSAEAGTDFTNTLTVDIAAGDYTAQTFAINLDILGDTDVEEDETITLALANPTGGNNGAALRIADANGDATVQNTNTYTILNDDVAVDPPIDPTDPPTDPTDPPTDPTDPPTDPTDPPTDPTDPPTDPTDPPTDPTDPPAPGNGFEGLTEQADEFTATDDADSVRGLGGDDVLFGEGGNDFMAGNEGNDEVYGGLGDDRVRGRLGNDVVFGGEDDDRVFGDRGDDILFGNGGNDFVKGGVGADTIRGGDGNDELVGNGGRDKIFGGNGNDLIVGGFGNDRLIGGDGDDTFVYRGRKDRLDRVVDFEVGADVLDMSQLLVRFDVTVSNNILGDIVQLEQRGSRTIVFFDPDGLDGGRSRSATLVLKGVDASDLGAASFEFG